MLFYSKQNEAVPRLTPQSLLDLVSQVRRRDRYYRNFNRL